MNVKVLSFIIPAYNSQAFLDTCIQSMLVPDLLDKLEIIDIAQNIPCRVADFAVPL